MPAMAAHTDIRSRSLSSGAMKELARLIGALPMQAAPARRMPSKVPTHHVAVNPQRMASMVSGCRPKIGGWNMVKYSRQIRIVI